MVRPMILVLSIAFSTNPVVAAPALKDRKVDDHVHIVGVWKQESISIHGGEAAAGVDTTFRFSNDGTCGIANGNNENGAKYSLLAPASPRRMRWLNGPQLTEWLCLYELEGDRLKVAFVDPGTEPPGKIEPAKNLTIYYLKRLKD